MKDSQKINLYCILEDIQEQLLIELKPNLRHAMKQLANKNIEASAKFIREVDRIMGDSDAEEFGNDADMLREKIEEIFR